MTLFFISTSLQRDRKHSLNRLISGICAQKNPCRAPNGSDSFLFTCKLSHDCRGNRNRPPDPPLHGHLSFNTWCNSLLASKARFSNVALNIQGSLAGTHVHRERGLSGLCRLQLNYAVASRQHLHRLQPHLHQPAKLHFKHLIPNQHKKTNE